MLLACALGTMGLPHVIVRLHVSLDGHEARRSIVAAQAMLALFCVVPPLYGVRKRIDGTGSPVELRYYSDANEKNRLDSYFQKINQ